MDTKTLFFIVLIATLIFAYFSQSTSVELCNEGLRRKVRVVPFLLSMLLPWFMLAFTNIGADYPNYYQIINEVDINNYNSFFFVEPGFALLSALLKIVFSDNIDAVLFVFKSFSIVGVYVSIYLLKDRLRIFHSVFAYMLLLFLPSFYLISQAMAATIVLLSISFYFRNKSKWIPLLLLLFGGLIHNSVYIFLPFAVLCHFLVMTKLTKRKIVLTAFVFIVMTVGASSIYGYAVSNIPGFHYVNYGDNSFEGSGMFFIVKYLPLFYMAFMVGKYSLNQTNKVFIIVFILASAMFNLLSYQFRVIERMEFLLLGLYILFLPMFMADQQYLRFNKNACFSNMKLFFYLYLCFLGYDVIRVRTSIAVDMSEYHFFNPFIA